MSSTYTVSEGARFVQQYIKKIPVEDVLILASDEINARMWRAYPWRWAINTLTPISLTDGIQDFGSAPTDYMRLTRARICRTDSTPDEYFEPLHIVNKLEPYLLPTTVSQVRSISYEGHLNKFRLERALSVGTGTTYQLQGEYQYQPTKITSKSTTLPFPDVYFDVFTAGLKWKFMEFAEDLRAGGSQTNARGASGYSGAKADFYEALYGMAESEGMFQGDILAPSETFFYE